MPAPTLALAPARAGTGGRRRQFGAVANFLAERFGWTPAEAERVEAKDTMLTAGSQGLRCAENCDGLQQRLILSDDELGKVVEKFPPQLRLSWEDNLQPKLDALQQ
eukprot:COSAG01_NODE_29198_length_643_cov_0.584559_1_plen_105_part_01